MKTEGKYTPFVGGLDTINPALNVGDGRLLQCENFDQVFGEQGYRRIYGYERFDGRAEPHKATYTSLEFDTGTDAIAVGNIVTGTGGASGEVVTVTVASGSWVGGNAAGTLILTNVTGAWADNGAITVGSQKATANGASTIGLRSDPDYITRLTAVRSYLRAKITAVPGEGAILGGAVYRETIYAMRNAVGGVTAAIYKSSASGWSLVRAGLYPGGACRMTVANFSGSSTEVSLFGVDGRNRNWKYDGVVFSFAAPIWGTQGTSTTSNTIGTGSKTFTIAQINRDWDTADSILVWSTANAGNRMLGTITSYSSGTNTLIVNVTSVVGSGTFTDWEIGMDDFTDKPYDLTDHKDHMFYAYPLGQLQTSNLGDPMIATTTAAAIGIGAEITGIRTLRGGLLGIFTNNSTSLLDGRTQLSWSIDKFSSTAGAKADTVAEVSGVTIYVDDLGITTLQATQAFGKFAPSILSRDVKALLDARINDLVCSQINRGNNQYRLMFGDKTVLTCTVLTPNQVVMPKDVAFTSQRYLHQATCAFGGELLNAEEAYFFGTDDGYVMRDGVGPSFDGAAIESLLRIPFSSFKSASNKKRFRKLTLDVKSPYSVQINFKQAFDYSDGNYTSSLNQVADATGGGGYWGFSDWDAFSWSLPVQAQAEANISGVGRNMSLLFWHSSATDAPFMMQGLLIHYTIFGLVR